MTPANGSRSTIAEMQRVLGDIQRSVGRIEGQTGAFIEQMKVQDDRATKLETRVRVVERWQHFYSGGGAIVGALLGAFGVHMRSG
jgi:hypothetical protein